MTTAFLEAVGISLALALIGTPISTTFQALLGLAAGWGVVYIIRLSRA